MVNTIIVGNYSHIDTCRQLEVTHIYDMTHPKSPIRPTNTFRQKSCFDLRLSNSGNYPKVVFQYIKKKKTTTS